MCFVLGAFQCTVLCILVHREMFFWSPFHEAFRCGLSGHIAMESGQPVFRCLSFSVLDAKSATANDLDKSLLDKFIHIVGCSEALLTKRGQHSQSMDPLGRANSSRAARGSTYEKQPAVRPEVS
jgi:hypothetical protein